MILKFTKSFLLVFILSALYANATELVQQKQIAVSRALAGQVVVLGTEEPMNGVTIDLCSPDWKKVIASTKTDAKGRFSLEQVANAKIFYLRVSAPGMNIYQLRVRIDKRSVHEIRIHLSVAT
jgi:hypothetical protein